MTPSRRTIVWWMLAGINLAAILNVTLYPTPRGAVAAAATPLLCVVCGPRGGVDVFLNVLMLVPLGVCLRLSGLSWGRVTLACGLLSLGIESLQYFVIPGRDAGLGDVLSNTTGGALGAAIAPHLKTMLSPGRRMATRLLRIGVAVWLGLALLSAWLFLPWRESAPAFSERSDQSGLPDAFAGGLGRVLLSGDSVPTGILDEKHSEWIRQVFASEHIGLRMEVVSSTPLRDSAWLYRVRIGPGILSIGQQGRALILEVPRRAAVSPVRRPEDPAGAGSSDHGRSAVYRCGRGSGSACLDRVHDSRPHAARRPHAHPHDGLGDGRAVRLRDGWRSTAPQLPLGGVAHLPPRLLGG